MDRHPRRGFARSNRMQPCPRRQGRQRRVTTHSPAKGKGQQKGTRPGKGKGKGKGKQFMQPKQSTAVEDLWEMHSWVEPMERVLESDARRGPIDAGCQVGAPPRAAASCLTAGYSIVHVPQAQSGLLSPSSYAAAGNGMEDHYGADTGKADYVLARSDDSRPTYGMEESSTGLPKQRGGTLDCSAHELVGQPGSLESHALVSHEAGLGLTEKTESQSTEEVMTKIGEMEALITGDSIKNFKSIRQLRESYQTEWVQFLIEVQIRGPGDRFWTILNELIGSAALHLLAARLRRDRHPFSGLAQSVQAQLW